MVEQGAHSGLNVSPSAHVHRFLLAPNDLGVGIALELALNEIPRERSELFYSANPGTIA